MRRKGQERGAEEKPGHGGGHGKGPGVFPGRRGGAVRGLHRETLDHKEVAVDRWVGGLQFVRLEVKSRLCQGPRVTLGHKVTKRVRTAQ